jgi:hypothetical protein
MKKIISILSALVLTACSVAPINTTTTARPLGKDQNLLTGNAIVTGVQYTRGLTEKMDVAFGIEEQFGVVFNMYGKYNFINGSDNGYSLAALGGIGYGSDLGHSKSVYAGGVASYRSGSFEPFFVLRLNYVDWKLYELTDNNRDDLVTIPSYKDTFLYAQTDAGFNYLNGVWGVTVGAHVYFFPENSSASPFAAIQYKF